MFRTWFLIVVLLCALAHGSNIVLQDKSCVTSLRRTKSDLAGACKEHRGSLLRLRGGVWGIGSCFGLVRGDDGEGEMASARAQQRGDAAESWAVAKWVGTPGGGQQDDASTDGNEEKEKGQYTPTKKDRRINITSDLRKSMEHLRSISLDSTRELFSDPMAIFRRRRPSTPGSKGPQGSFANVGWEAMLEDKERAKLQVKWGPLFEQAVDEAHAIFKKMLKNDAGKLTKEEFAHALRFMQADRNSAAGSRGKQAYDRLIDFMFFAIDLDGQGMISFYEFVEWMLMMTAGTYEDKLRWGFIMCDMDRDGRVVRTEVTALLTSMFSVLTGLRLDYHNPYVDMFVHDLFEYTATNSSGKQSDGDWSEERGLTWEEYRAGCLRNTDVLSMLHSAKESYRCSSVSAPTCNTHVHFFDTRILCACVCVCVCVCVYVRFNLCY
jgi:Ca2+-binding EF-hand superfamily protein